MRRAGSNQASNRSVFSHESGSQTPSDSFEEDYAEFQRRNLGGTPQSPLTPETYHHGYTTPAIAEVIPYDNDIFPGISPDFQRPHAQSIVRREAVEAFNQTQRYTPDCGLSGAPYHLSLFKAKEVSANMSVGKLNDYGEKQDLPMSTDLGWYPLPCAQVDESKDALEECGPGIVHYFKLLKSLIVIFVIMAFITTPSIVMYGIGNSKEQSASAFTSVVDSKVSLSYTTLGSLGEPIPSCRQVPESNMFSFRCPSNGKISSIVSYYGKPHGSCGCPSSQLPVEAGVCNGSTSGVFGQTFITNPYLYEGQTCVRGLNGEVDPCFLGSTRYNSECCSTSLDSAGFADLSALSIAVNPTCNSLTAPYVLKALCLGQSSCSLPVLIDSNISLPIASFDDESLASSLCTSYNSTTCITTLAHRGVFTGCSSNSTNNLLFEGICFKGEISGTDTLLDNMQHKDIVYYSSLLDFISIAIFLFGILYIRLKQDDVEFQQEKSVCRASDYTVECATIPNSLDHNIIVDQVKDHFETVLSEQEPIHYDIPIKVADINVGTAHYEYIQMACQRGNYARGVDRILCSIIARLRTAEFDYNSWTDISLLNGLKKAMYRYEIANIRCENMQQAATRELNRLYITFETEEGALRCLRAYTTNGVLGRCFQTHRYLLDGKPVRVKRAIDPSEIRWENVGVPLWSRVLRVLITTSITIGLLAVSYVMIFEALSFSESSASKKYTIACGTYSTSLNTDPTYMQSVDANTITYQKVLQDHNWKAYNQSYSTGEAGYLFCFCEKLNYEKGFNEMKNFEFYNTMIGSKENWCAQLVSSEKDAEFATYIATAIIILINACLHEFLKYMTEFECPISDTYEVVSVALKLCLAQYINTGLLSLVIYGDLAKVGGSNLFFGKAGSITFGVFTGSFRDFDSAWYAAVGTSLLFTMTLVVIGSQVFISLLILYKKMLQRFDQFSGCTFSASITHKELQADLEQLYLKVEFPFDRHLATMVSLIFVCTTYSSTMPAMNIICCVSLILFYFINKYYILRFHSLPAAYSVKLPRIMTQLLYGAALIHSLMGAWMFGNNSYYAPNYQHEDTIVENTIPPILSSTHSWQEPINWYERLVNRNSVYLLGTGISLILILLTLLINSILRYFFGLKTIDDFLDWLRKRNSWMKFRLMEQNLPPYFDSFPIPLLHSRINSGVIRGELKQKYRKRLGKLLTNEESLPSKLMEGLESYRLSLSPEYFSRFGLDSFYMRRNPPTDWIVSNGISTATASLQVTGDRSSGRHSMRITTYSLQDAFIGVEAYERELDEILEYCSPIKSQSTYRIQRRYLNNFFARMNHFNNDKQIGIRMYSTELNRLSTNHEHNGQRQTNSV